MILLPYTQPYRLNHGSQRWAGNVIYRLVYDTYGELSDIRTDDGISLKTAEAVQDAVKDITLAELADATGIEYLYNGQYGVTTDRNGLYYMRARYYDQDIKRFINRDVVSGDITNSFSLNRYCYVQGNPVSLADPFGLCPDGNSTMQGLANSMMRTTDGMFSIADQVNDIYNSSSYFGHMLLSRIGTCWHGADIINEVWYAAERNYDAISTYGHAALDLAGIIWDGADVINALWYAAEGNYDMAVVSAICALPFVGNIVGGSAGLAMKMIGHGLTFAMATEGTIEAVGRAVDAYQEGNLSWWNALDVGINVLGMGLAGRAAYSSGKQLASCVASSNAGKRISNNIRSFMADNRGCVDLDAFKTSYGQSSENLNWDAVVSKKTGETRIEHVKLHETNDLTKQSYDVFYGDSQNTINKACSIDELKQDLLCQIEDKVSIDSCIYCVS